MPYADLHCHLLWATDDGCRDESESLALCRALAEHGFSDAAPSPHAWPENPDARANGARRGELAALLAENGIALALHAGAENRLDGELLERARKQDARPIGAGNWLLAEASHHLPNPGLEELCFRLRVEGYRVLIAHPERCRAFFDDAALAQRLVESGCALQLELGTLANIYGKDSARLGRKLLDAGLYAVAASDVHRPQSGIRLLELGLPALRKAVGEVALLRLLDENPRRILRGEALA
jgi:protein-tyrosine phosphatase